MATQYYFYGSGGGSECVGVEEYKLFLRVCLRRLTIRGARGDTLLPSFAPPLHQSIFTHTHKNRNVWILQTSLKRGTIPLSAPFIPGKSLWILIALLGGSGGQRESSNLAEAEQKWNFDLTEGRIIPHWQSGGYLFLPFPPFWDSNSHGDLASRSPAVFPSRHLDAHVAKKRTALC